MEYPYGKAPFAILVAALATGAYLLSQNAGKHEADLVVASFAKTHLESYREVIESFEEKHGVEVQFQLFSYRALQDRLRNALLAGADVPDLVEIEGSLSFFAKGPIEDLGFMDLTDFLERDGLMDRLVQSRLSLWEKEGRVFALPHDVHPVLLAYRRDIVEELGIDVEELKTWDDFVRVGREVSRDNDGDGLIDRYMIDLPSKNASGLRVLLPQRGIGQFDREGNVVFDDEIAVDTICWYAEQLQGTNRIAFSTAPGQAMYQAMLDGLVLFYICPDWRSGQFELDVPGLSGKMALMPLPAWEPGGRRVSTWGGTGLTITKQCAEEGKADLAWELAKHLYLNPEDLEARFLKNNIIPPLKDAWDLEGFKEPRAYWSGQPLGAMYAEYAAETPPKYSTAYMMLADVKQDEALTRALVYHAQHGQDGLREYVRETLKEAADYVRRVMARNRFLAEEEEGEGTSE